MRYRNTVILLGILAILGAYVWFFERGPADAGDAATATPAPEPILAFDPHAARALSLSRPADGASTRLEYAPEEETWYVAGPGEREAADQTQVTLLVSYLSDLTPLRVLEGPLDSMATYGLDPARAQATVVLEGGGEVALEIGEESLTSAAHYARLPGDGAVYTISSYIGENVLRFIDAPPYRPTPTPTAEPTPTPAQTPTP